MSSFSNKVQHRIISFVAFWVLQCLLKFLVFQWHLKYFWVRYCAFGPFAYVVKTIFYASLPSFIFKSGYILFWSLPKENFLFSSSLHLCHWQEKTHWCMNVDLWQLLLCFWATFKFKILCPAFHMKMSFEEQITHNGW